VISRALIIILIAFAIFAHTIILGLNYSPSYAYSPCNCVIFAMDDIADHGGVKVQLATMDYFISKNLPFTASIIARDLANANSSNLDVFHKVEEGVNKGLFEIAIHGYRHVNHSLLTREEQLNDFSKAKGKLEYLFGKSADIFIPPFNDFNLYTIEALSDLNITLFSTSPDSELTTPNPYKNQTLVVTNSSKLQVSKISEEKPLVYHAPFSVSFLRLEGVYGLSGNSLVEESLRLIDESIAKYGFAQVRLHPSDFSQVNATSGKRINEIDDNRFQHLTQLVNNLEDRNIRIASFSEIYPHSAAALDAAAALAAIDKMQQEEQQQKNNGLDNIPYPRDSGRL
jgi:peptidoglycan/xylan/chitin deacetylase (PgdA/CDA1 family)